MPPFYGGKMTARGREQVWSGIQTFGDVSVSDGQHYPFRMRPDKARLASGLSKVGKFLVLSGCATTQGWNGAENRVFFAVRSLIVFKFRLALVVLSG